MLITLPAVQDEKEQLNDFKARLEGLKQRAKTIIQLKPRNPATAIKSKLPIQAVCDFKQMEVGHSCSTAKLTSLLKKQQQLTSFYLAIFIAFISAFISPQITVHRGDECALLNNLQPFKWRVLNDKGSEASVPSICFLVPPTNKDAVNSAAE